MIKFWLVSLLALFICSCATLTQQRTVNVNVLSANDTLKIRVISDSSQWFNTPAMINVRRSRQNLLIAARKDSIEKVFQVNSRLSSAFVVGNLFSGAGLIGYAIDWSNTKRFTYPSSISIDFDANNYAAKSKMAILPPERHLLNVRLSIPEGNHFYLNKGHGYGNAFGFLGISGGVEYYLTDHTSISTDVGVLIDFLAPFPAPVDYDGAYQRSSATYADLQLGRDFKRWHTDFGFQFTRTEHYERGVELFPQYIDTLKYSIKQNNLGLALSTYYRLFKGFNLGLNYYPSFVAFDHNSLQKHYSHLIFFELIFKMEAFRPKRKDH